MESNMAINKNQQRKVRKFHLLMILWTLLMLGGIFISGFFLRKNANPWTLELTIPSELPKNHGINMNTSDPKLLDFSDDGNMLIISRNAMTADIWDIDKKIRIIKLGKPIISEEDVSRNEALVPPYVAFLPKQKGILVNKKEQTFETHIFHYDLSGSEHEIYMSRDGSQGEVLSPKGQYIAFKSLNKIIVIGVNTGTLIKKFPIENVFSMECKVQWSNDESLLFFSCNEGFWLWDFEKGDLIYSYRELDITLPTPMIADENSGLKELARKRMERKREESIEEFRSNKNHIAYLEDSAISHDGKYIAACYSGHSMTAGSETRRARLYDAVNGELLWDYIVEKGSPTSVMFSPDGSELLVAIGSWLKERRSALITYDVTNRRVKTSVELNAYKIDSIYLRRNLSISPDGKKIVLCDNPPVVFDLNKENIVAPLRGLSSYSNARYIAFSNDGNRVAAYSEKSDVCVWRKMREGSSYGVFARLELWLILLFSILLIVGLLTIKGALTQALIKQSIPTSLWIAVILLGLAASLQLTECVSKIALGKSLEINYIRIHVGRHIASSIASFIWISLCLILMKPRKGIIYIYSALLAVGLWLIFGMLIFQYMSAPDAITAAREGKIFRLLSHDFRISPRLVYTLITIYIMYPVLILLLIKRHEVQKMMFLPNKKTRFAYLSHLSHSDK